MFDDIFPENYEETHNTNYDHTKNSKLLNKRLNFLFL